MARGRMVNTTVSSDLRLNGLSLEAHCVYMMAIPHLDRDGIMAGHPQIVSGKVCPLRPELGKKISKIIKEWIDSDLVFEFSTENGSALYFFGFQKNQSLGATYAREAKSEFPPPPGYTRTEHGLEPISDDQLMTNSRPTHELVMSDSREGHAEGKEKLKGREVKREVKGKGRENGNVETPPTEPLPPALDIFREFCLKRVNQTQTDAIASAINDLGLWRQVLTEWSLRGYNMGNVNGLLDWYRDGIPPVTHRNGHNGNGTKHSQSSDGDNPPKLDPELQRKFDERAKRKIAPS